MCLRIHRLDEWARFHNFIINDDKNLGIGFVSLKRYCKLRNIHLWQSVQEWWTWFGRWSDYWQRKRGRCGQSQTLSYGHLWESHKLLSVTGGENNRSNLDGFKRTMAELTDSCTEGKRGLRVIWKFTRQSKIPIIEFLRNNYLRLLN